MALVDQDMRNVNLPAVSGLPTLSQASCQHPLRTRKKTFSASEIRPSIRKPVPFGTGNSLEGYKQTNLRKAFVSLGLGRGVFQFLPPRRVKKAPRLSKTGWKGGKVVRGPP